MVVGSSASALRIKGRAGPSAMSILLATTLGSFALPSIGLGWVKSDVAQLRTELKAYVVADHGQISSISKRLMGVETLLEDACRGTNNSAANP